jgi:hypothetical protein
MVKGQNLGLSGAISFHGRATSAVVWTPTALVVWVPLQASYPDVGPVTVTVDGQTATGPGFTTTRPGGFTLTLPALPVPAAPAASPSGAQPSSPPTISQVTDGRRQRTDTVFQGRLFSLRGQGFGTNATRKGRVLFVTATGTPINGTVWGWADDGIDLFAPYVRGPVTVAVQVDGGSGLVTSNRVPLTIQ